MHYQLVDHSIALKSLQPSDIEDILATSRSFNAVHDISGCLLYHHHEFVQLLEGGKGDVSALYKRIQADPRHKHVEIFLDGDAKTRMFSKWYMAFKRLQPRDLDISGGHFKLANFPGLLKHLNKPETIHKLFANVALSILAEKDK